MINSNLLTCKDTAKNRKTKKYSRKKTSSYILSQNQSPFPSIYWHFHHSHAHISDSHAHISEFNANISDSNANISKFNEEFHQKLHFIHQFSLSLQSEKRHSAIGEGTLPPYPMEQFNQSIQKSLEDLKNCLITVSNGTKQCKAS